MPGWDALSSAPPVGRPDEIDGWAEQVGEVKNADKDRGRSSYTAAGTAKYFLLWITKASPASDQEGRFQIEISDTGCSRGVIPGR